tara:strand:- start:6390 stop:6662 length:273 start_codon:yes stop_codon:yes gene_type:complete
MGVPYSGDFVLIALELFPGHDYSPDQPLPYLGANATKVSTLAALAFVFGLSVSGHPPLVALQVLETPTLVDTVEPDAIVRPHSPSVVGEP